MSRPFSAVTAAALASVVTMTAFVVWTSVVGFGTTQGCCDRGCNSQVASSAPNVRKSLGLIDL